jgi:hypothetical protein
MTAEQLKFCESIGGGNAAQGVRFLIDKAMAGQPLAEMTPKEAVCLALALLEKQEAQT